MPFCVIHNDTLTILGLLFGSDMVFKDKVMY